MAADRPRALLSWSSGKDGAAALLELRRRGELDVVATLTTLTQGTGRVAMHGVREALLDRQAAALGLPALKVPIPSPCPDTVYAAAMRAVLGEARARGVTHVVFGDLFLADLRAWREARLAEAGMAGAFPLWGRDTRTLAREILAAGIEAVVVCVDPRRLDGTCAGRRYDAAFLAALPPGVDPCGENGEFHTVVTAGPMFAAPIPVAIGAVTERDGFVHADVVPLG